MSFSESNAATVAPSSSRPNSAAPSSSRPRRGWAGTSTTARPSGVMEPLAQRHDLLLLPLHGSLPAEEQNRALRPARWVAEALLIRLRSSRSSPRCGS